MIIDPYTDWLGIPANRRPPSHYDLLGLEPFEADIERIRSAGMRRIADVRRYQVGPHSDSAIRLMGELAAAFSCLTDATRKVSYDLGLRGAASEVSSAPAPTPTPPSTADAAPADPWRRALQVHPPLVDTRMRVETRADHALRSAQASLPPVLDTRGASASPARDTARTTPAPEIVIAQLADPAAFDPCAEWLNIPPTRRPPSSYDLLGIVEGESDLDVIRRAGLERMSYLRDHLQGPRGDAAGELLALVSQAFFCLTDPNRKRAYDHQRGELAAESRVAPPVTAESHEALRVAPLRSRSPPHRGPPPDHDARLVNCSPLTYLDRGLAYLAGGEDNRLTHYLIRLATAIVAAGIVWVGCSKWQASLRDAATSNPVALDVSKPKVVTSRPTARSGESADAAIAPPPVILEWPDWIVAEGMSSVLKAPDSTPNPREGYFEPDAAHGARYDAASSEITWTPPAGSAGKTYEFTLWRRRSQTPAACFKAIVVPRVVVNSIGVELTLIPAGAFKQGSSETDPLAESDETPPRTVTISRPFYLGVHEITQAQWRAVMETNPSQFIGDSQRPVERVTWENAAEFCRRLNRRDRLTAGYRLPTEAEWEYACRAGATTAWSFGDDPDLLEIYAWTRDNAADGPRPARTRKANAWGLCDMHGNVWEWCWDWYANNAYATGDVTDPRGPDTGSLRVLRGGAWNIGLHERFRCSVRFGRAPNKTDDATGLRVARDLPGISTN